MNRSAMSKHRRLCKNVQIAPDAEKEQLRERVASLEAQVAVDREQLRSAGRKLGGIWVEYRWNMGGISPRPRRPSQH
jgi:hypothetical protein